MNFKIIVTKIETDNMTRRLIYTILTPGFNDDRVSPILRACEVKESLAAYSACSLI
jgi:hypothetical protein